MPMIPNSPDPDRHKKPMWRGWQMPEFRPSCRNPWSIAAPEVWARFT